MTNVLRMVGHIVISVECQILDKFEILLNSLLRFAYDSKRNAGLSMKLGSTRAGIQMVPVVPHFDSGLGCGVDVLS